MLEDIFKAIENHAPTVFWLVVAVIAIKMTPTNKRVWVEKYDDIKPFISDED